MPCAIYVNEDNVWHRSDRHDGVTIDSGTATIPTTTLTVFPLPWQTCAVYVQGSEENKISHLMFRMPT